jgi:hypothetical protein
MNKKKPQKNSLLTVVLLTFIIANPFVLSVVFKNILISFLSPIFIFIVIYLMSNKLVKARWVYLYTVNFLIIISIFIHFEFLFRYRYSDYIIENIYTFENNYFFNKPNLDKVFKDKEFQILYRTNNQGFRFGEYNQDDMEIRECDWLFLGDSFTQGAQVDFEELYTSRLYKYFPDKIIVNAGISGAGIVEEYYLYLELIKKVNPEVIFLQLCNFNDFMNVEIKKRDAIDYLMHYSDFFRFILYDLKFNKIEELPLGRWTEPFYKNVEDNVNYNIFYKSSSVKKRKDIQSFNKYFYKLCNQIQKDGRSLIVILVPTKEQMYFKYLNEVLTNYDIDPEQLDMFYPNKLVKKVSDSLNIEFIDLYEYYIKYSDEVFFEYDEHLNNYGHKVTADVIAELLSKYKNKNLKFLSKDFTGDRYPSYCKNSEKIIFQSVRNGTTELFIADSAFESIERLTYNDVDEYHPCFFSNDKIIFTQGDQNSLMTEIILMNLNGNNRQILTYDKNFFGAIPMVSYDKSLITFAMWHYNQERKKYSNPKITIYDKQLNLIFEIGEKEYEYWRPVFSPDNKFVIYIAKKDGDYDIFKFELESQIENQLTFTNYDEWDPIFCSTGSKIIYAANKYGNWDIFEMDNEGNNTKQITFSKGNEWDPYYFKDCNKIIFAGEFGFFRGIYELKIKQ